MRSRSSVARNNFGVFDFDLVRHDSLARELQLLFLLQELNEFVYRFAQPNPDASTSSMSSGSSRLSVRNTVEGATETESAICVILSPSRRFPIISWVHKAIELPREEFKREVEKQLTGQETELWEILYFKVYKSQLPVIEQALETAGLMLGNDKSRGYCLEMICADFLAGANLESGELATRQSSEAEINS